MKRAFIHLIALIPVLFTGCAFSGSAIRPDRVQSLVPGISTKSQLFEKFGVPAIISAKDEIMTLSVAPVPSGSNPNLGRSAVKFRSDTFFTLFPPADEYHRVYYYYRVYTTSYPVWYILYFGTNGKTETDRLWVLVNEKTGLVKDYAYKRYGQDTVFGMPRIGSLP